MDPIKVVIPLSPRDFDPTEVAVSWKVLRAAGVEVVFATPDGQRGYADPVMVTGEGLDPWGFLPVFRSVKIIGLFLRAWRDARRAYAELERAPAFLAPMRYGDLRGYRFDGLLLPGGHARGMRVYLEDEGLQEIVAQWISAGKPTAAVCHGVLLAARSRGADGRSVLYGRKVTSLPWRFEHDAWNLTRFFARFWDPDYYRTYTEDKGEPVGYRSVEEEVKRQLAAPADFLNVPSGDPHYLRRGLGLFRDRDGDDRAAWVVRDGNLITARWPGDVHTFAARFVDLLREIATD